MMSRHNITCHCNVCASSTCITEGKCYSSVELDRKPTKLVQRCLAPAELVPPQRPMICQLHQARQEHHIINCCDQDLCNSKPILPETRTGDELSPLAWIIPSVVLASIVIVVVGYLYYIATRNSHASSKFTFNNFIFACLSAVGFKSKASGNSRRNLTKITRLNGCTSTSSGADSLKNIDIEAATSIMSSVEMPLLTLTNQEDLSKLPHVNGGHSVDLRSNLTNCPPSEFNASLRSHPASACGNSSIGGSNFIGGRTSTSSVTTNTAARTDQTTLLSTIVSDDNFSSSGSGPPLLIQRSIARQIDLGDKIGSGRFGAVYKGEWRGETVAVKIFSSIDESSWHREVEIYQTSMLRHENILGYISSDNKDNGTWIQLWLITDYHEFGSLYDYLTDHTLTVSQMTSMALSIAAGLSHLHHEIDGFQGKPAIAHRDIKSRNILVKSNLQCAIADLGLAVRQLSDSSGVDLPSERRVGTKRYLPPEVLVIPDDNLKISEFDFDAFIRGDIYSFGLVLWELANRTSFNYRNTFETVKNDQYSRVTAAPDAHVTQVPANTYQLPYYDMVSADPTIDEMKEIVVDKNIRPPLSTHWTKNATLKRMSQIMNECWCAEPKARISTLRAKKNLSALNKSLLECKDNVHVNSMKLNSSQCNSSIIASTADHSLSNVSLCTSLSSNNIAANDGVNISHDNLVSNDVNICNINSLSKLPQVNETQLNAINQYKLPDHSSSSSTPSSTSSLTTVPPSADSCSVLFSSDSSQSTAPSVNGSINRVNHLPIENNIMTKVDDTKMKKQSDDDTPLGQLHSSKDIINNASLVT